LASSKEEGLSIKDASGMDLILPNRVDSVMPSLAVGIKDYNNNTGNNNAYGRRINMLKNFENVQDGWGYQFEVAAVLSATTMM
jgi:hypothetical protein